MGMVFDWPKLGLPEGCFTLQGADLHWTDGDGLQALHWAAREGHVAAVQALLDAGANAEGAGWHGLSMAFLGCRKCYHIKIEQQSSTNQQSTNIIYIDPGKQLNNLNHVKYLHTSDTRSRRFLDDTAIRQLC